MVLKSKAIPPTARTKMARQTKFVTPQVEQLAQTFLTEIRTDRLKTESAIEMLHNPVVNAALELRVLLTIYVLEDYTHPDKEKQAFIRSQFAQMDLGFWGTIKELETYRLAFGNVFAEVPIAQGYNLVGIRPLYPGKYTYSGSYGDIKQVIYRGARKNISIEYKSGIHLVNKQHMAIGRDPRGVGYCEMAQPYWEGLKILAACMIIAAEHQANPLLVGQTDTNQDVDLIDEAGARVIQNGEIVQINRGTAMLNALLKTKSTGAFVADISDKIQAIATETEGALLLAVAKYFERMILLCLLIPDTILSVGGTGTGDSGLNSGHRDILMRAIKSNAYDLSESMIKSVVKKIIIYHFGIDDDYGSLPIREEENENVKDLVDAIMRVVDGGVYAPQDQAVVDRVKDLLQLDDDPSLVVQETMV